MTGVSADPSFVVELHGGEGLHAMHRMFDDMW